MKIIANKSAQTLITAGIEKLNELNFTQKLYGRDGSLWKQDLESIKFIESFLGWTEIYDWSFKQIPEIKTFAQEVKNNFNHIVLMGMGGSSLAPEVLRVIFGRQKGYPELFVLDSTNPDWICRVRSQIDPLKTLFIFASKSGGTVEPSSQFAYFYDEVSKVSKTPGANFIAITDPETGLETLAKQKNFRKIFLNPADIGGRFSALSLFGLVPAALCGFDIDDILKKAARTGDNFKTDKNSAAAQLGALIGQAYAAGRDKLVLLMPSNIDIFGLWVEQLVAESTGKERKGIVPVSGELLHENFEYKNDRIFVYISCGGANDAKVRSIAGALAKTEHPIVEIDMEETNAVGAQFLLWEIATAAAGALMQINPFDQPNVQLAKTITKSLLTDLEAGKKSAQTTAEILTSKNLMGKINLPTLTQDIYNIIKNNDYVALLPYLNASKDIDDIFAVFRDKILTHTKNSVLFGYGPRYLHSTGQLHKGDGNNGIFIIMSADAQNDVKIPGQTYTFADLCNAQALADFKALEEKGRRAVKLHFKQPLLDELKKLISQF
ncbi:MAG: glucose-6-phosphate isomerase [Elusimicrobiota bacterium]|jgi:glucose-6-phosphate isomerase|nr:glucose-6-phosphate isomerase [Elusimicrobiota bacterium]